MRSANHNKPANFSFFWAAMTLNGPKFCRKRYLFTKEIDFPKIRYKNVKYLNLGHAHKPFFFLCVFFFFAIALSNFFPRPFPFLSFGPFTLATSCVSYILSVFCK